MLLSVNENSSFPTKPLPSGDDYRALAASTPPDLINC